MRGAALRTLGLLGGMSWESTAIYYRLLNEGVKARRGGLSSAQLLLWSVDFASIAAQQAAGDWATLAHTLGDAGNRLAQAGAGALLICANTMHRLYDDVVEASGVPVIHIADGAGKALADAQLNRPVLLGTRFTMEGDFYLARLRDRFGIEAVTPDADERALVHDVIYDELCQGVVREASRRTYLAIIERLLSEGADSVILGCTEIGLMLREQDVAVPLFDTAKLHAAAGVDWLLADEGKA
jgi:aspartate racemase